MPSGAKKRKAAKRKKEEQEQRQQPGGHPTDAPTSPATGPPHPSPGDGEREEEDDLNSQEDKGSESGSDVASPTATGNHHHHHHHRQSPDFEADEEQAEGRVEAKGAEEDKERSGTTSLVDTVFVMESVENGGSEQPSGSLAPQKTGDDFAKKSKAEVPVVAVEAKGDVVPPPPPSDPAPPPSADVPISENEEVAVEHILCEKGKDVAVSGDMLSLIEPKQPDAVDTAKPVELSVPISEQAAQASDVPVESLIVAESAADAALNKNEEKVVPLTDASGEQPDLSVESHSHTESREIAGTTEVARPTQLERRASWMNCCGLFDLFTGANR